MNDADQASGHTVVVGYDGSDTAKAAVAYAIERAGVGGRVWVVHSFDPPPDWLGAPNYQRLLNEHRDRGEAILDAAIEGQGDAANGVQVAGELVGQPAAEAIIATAEARNADEIVVGSRGFGRFRSALGSVSHEVLHLADRPVVVVPARSTSAES